LAAAVDAVDAGAAVALSGVVVADAGVADAGVAVSADAVVDGGVAAGGAASAAGGLADMLPVAAAPDVVAAAACGLLVVADSLALVSNVFTLAKLKAYTAAPAATTTMTASMIAVVLRFEVLMIYLLNFWEYY
jgi:hypothetical protein